jgi:hypothetical protein
MLSIAHMRLIYVQRGLAGHRSPLIYLTARAKGGLVSVSTLRGPSIMRDGIERDARDSRPKD